MSSNRNRIIGQWRKTVLLAVSAGLLLLFAVPSSASADLRFCSSGSGAGQCSEQGGVATDFETERVYVADKGNNRIDVFEADGTFLFAFGWKVNAAFPVEGLQTCTVLTGCQKGSVGTGDGQLRKPRQVAVDNDPASGSHHDVYVFDSGNLRVQKFDPSGGFLEKVGTEGTGPGQFKEEADLVTVAPSGKVYVGDTPKPKEPRIEVFDSELGLLEEFKLAHQDSLNNGLAVDSAGNVYAVFNIPSRIFKFHPGGTEFGVPYPLEPGYETVRLAVGVQDQLFAGQSAPRVGKVGGTFPVITVYGSTGEYLERFGYGLGVGGANETFSGFGVVHSGGVGLRRGDVFAGLNNSSNRVAYVPMPSPGPVIAPLSVEALKVGNTSVVLAGELDPEGGRPTKYHFEYVDQHSFETEGGFKSAHTKETTGGEVAIAPGTPAVEEQELFSLHTTGETPIGCAEPLSETGHPGETEIQAGNCLSPETTYRFRLVADNPEGKAEPVEGQFQTRAPLEILEAWASEPTTDGARLSARVDPLGLPTSGFFEYVDQETFEADGFAEAKQVPDVLDGASPLDFGSGAASARSVSLGGLVPGRTYRYRLVADDPLLPSPVLGSEGAVRPFAKPAQAPCRNDEFRSGAGALLADCRAYEMVSPLDKNNGDIVPLGEFTTNVPAALNESSVSGGRVSYTTATAFGDTQSAPFSAEYVAERGGDGWESHSIDSPKSNPVVDIPTQIQTEFRLFSPDLCEVWQRTVADPPLTADAVAGYPNIYRRTDQSCGGAPDYEALTTVTPPDTNGEHYSLLELQGVSADDGVAVYAAPDNLAVGAAPQPVSCTNIGESCQLRLYEKRPGQEPKFVCFLPDGEALGASCGAGSGGDQDGKNLYGNEHNAISTDGQRIYWSGGGKVYLRVDGTETLAVSAAGETLSGTSASTFLGASSDGATAVFLTEKAGGAVADLYEFDEQSETTKLIAHKVVGFAGMSEDGSRVYFASTEVLTTEPNSTGRKAQAGEPNLYLAEGESTRFVATLTKAELETPFSAVRLEPIQRMSRVGGGADGSRLAFITTTSPTGYDNTDVSSPEGCGEAHPQGICDAEVFLYDATTNEGKGRLVCVSCNPSGARPVGEDIKKRNHISNRSLYAAAEFPAWENNLYASRVLSVNGRRLFFESSDALSPVDTNGVTDVYEWEETGEGTCTQGSSSYAPESDGCVDLVSSGKSARESTFLDADSSGKNVFFTTLSSLVSQDYGLVDVYDARENGGFAPPPPAKVECEGEACQSAPEAPNDSTPSSGVFEGAGNLVEELPVVVKPKARTLTRAQRLARALRACRSRPKRVRARCRARARKGVGR